MKSNEFVWNDSKTSLVNLSHVIQMSIEEPKYEAKDYRIIAILTHGTAVLHRGSKESCDSYLADIYYSH